MAISVQFSNFTYNKDAESLKRISCLLLYNGKTYKVTDGEVALSNETVTPLSTNPQQQAQRTQEEQRKLELTLANTIISVLKSEKEKLETKNTKPSNISNEDKNGNKQADETGNKQADETGNKQAEKTGNKQADETGNKPAEKNGNNQAEKNGNNQADQIGRETPNQSRSFDPTQAYRLQPRQPWLGQILTESIENQQNLVQDHVNNQPDIRHTLKAVVNKLKTETN